MEVVDGMIGWLDLLEMMYRVDVSNNSEERLFETGDNLDCAYLAT